VTQSGVFPVSSVTRRDAVLNELRRAILVGELAAGERLKEVQLAERLGVSRPTLREAIYQLVHEGLLVQQAYKGISVAEMNADSIKDVAAVRAALETVAGLAIGADKTGGSQQMLGAAWSRYQEAAASGDPVDVHQSHIELHRTIWLASHNTMLERIWPIVQSHINLAVSTDQSTRADLARAHETHRRLVEAILGNRRRQIQAEVEQHIEASADELLKLISAKKS
jgi:DNA-binding GntR family transcriptional regulator